MEKFIFYKDWRDAFSTLPAEMRVKAYEAVFDFAFDGVEPEDPMINVMTYVMRARIVRDREHYNAAIARRKAAIKAYKEKQQSIDN